MKYTYNFDTDKLDIINTISDFSNEFLLLDQTTPQKVENGKPNFEDGILIGTDIDDGIHVLQVNGPVYIAPNPIESSLQVNNYGFQGILNNCWFGDNIYYDGVTGFVYRENGAGNLFYTQENEFQFRLFSSGNQGDNAPSYGCVQMKVNSDGEWGLGGATSTSEGIDTATDSWTGAQVYKASNGNFMIGTTTDDGINKLQVNGNGKFMSQTTDGFVKFVNSDGTLGVDTNTYLTYWDSISYADSAGYASSASSADYWAGYSFPGYSYGTPGYMYNDGYGGLSWATLDLSGYVPYTGASNNVDLGTYTLTTTGYITAELAKVTTDAPSTQQGDIWLDTDEPELYEFGGNSDYTKFNTTTGHQTMIGSARPWRDELGDVTKLRIQGPGVEDNFAQATVKFTNLSNMSDFIYTNLQLNHDKDLSSELHPHLHWFQLGSSTNAGSVTPNFYLEHRWQVNGGSMTPTWTGAINTTNAFPSVGSVNQITMFPAITPPSGTSISDIVQFKIYRDNGNTTGSFATADNIAGDVDLTSFDVHFMTNSLGSDEEYVK